MDNLTFGDKNLFSINIETDNHFANISMFCHSDKMGNNEEYTLLDTFLALLDDKINNYEYSLADKIIDFDKNAVFLYVVNGYKDSENWKHSQYLSSVWITLDLTPCFDGDVLILLSSVNYDRVIWKKFSSDVIKEFFLPAGYVMKQLNLLLNNF